VGGLSGGEQQGIAIGRASYFGASMLILDEPTTGLSLRQSKHVLEIVAATKEKGLAILFISHNIFDAVEVADDVAVLDRGVVVNQYLKSDITALSLMEFMENTAAGRGG
jgi:simple sugar transport system ATP-binding protein